MLFPTSLMSLMVVICMHAQISAKSQSSSSRPVAQGSVPKPAHKLDNKQQSTKTPAGTSKPRLVQASETKGAGRPSQLKDGGNTGSTQVVSFNRKSEVNPQSSSGTLRGGPEQAQKSVNTPVYNTALEAIMETTQSHTLPVSPLEEYDRQEYELTDNLKNDALDALPKDADRNDAGFPIPIQTRSGGCSMPEVLGGGNALPWTCRQSQQWRHLGENVYPSRLYETVCEGRSCWYGHYNCTPIYYTLQVLKMCDQGCNDQRVPYPLRSRWQWLSYNVTVGCQCVR